MTAVHSSSTCSVRAFVDASGVRTGDFTLYHIQVTSHAATLLRRPDVALPDGLFLAETKSVVLPQASSNLHATDYVFKIRADLPGTYLLKPVLIQCSEQEQASTAEIVLEVASQLQPNDTTLRDLKPLEPPFPMWLLYAIGIVSLGVLSGLLFWRYRKPRIRPQVPQKQLSPHVVALQALDRLRQSDLSHVAAKRAFFFTISEILRTYIEGTCHMNATDLTSEEILKYLNDHSEFHTEHQFMLRQFFQRTDAIKFADAPIQDTDLSDVYEWALSFVEKTSQPREPQA